MSKYVDNSAFGSAAPPSASTSTQVSEAVALVQPPAQRASRASAYTRAVSLLLASSAASSASSDPAPGDEKALAPGEMDQVPFDPSMDTVVCVLRQHPQYASSYVFCRIIKCPNDQVSSLSEYPASMIEEETARQWGESDLPTWVIPLPPKMPTWQSENLARREQLRAALRANPPQPHESTIGYLKGLFVRILKNLRIAGVVKPRERLLVEVLLEECDNSFVTNREQATNRIQSLAPGAWLIRQSSIASNPLIKVNVITFKHVQTGGVNNLLIAKVSGLGYISFNPGVDDGVDYANLFREKGMPEIGSSMYVTILDGRAFPSLLELVEHASLIYGFRLDLFVTS